MFVSDLQDPASKFKKKNKIQGFVMMSHLAALWNNTFMETTLFKLTITRDSFH